MHEIDLILTLTGGLAAALALGFLTFKLKMSPIVGYLIAGIFVGPYTPGYHANVGLAEQLAEVGVILLMFGVGLQFHIEELIAVRRVAIPGALVQCTMATLFGAVIAHAFGWSWGAGLVFGMAISVASTVVLLRVLSENRDLHTPSGHIAVGWLVVEDLITVLVLVLLPSLVGPSLVGAESFAAGDLLRVLGIAALKLLGLVGVVFILGGRAIPWLLEQVALSRSRELFTLTVLVVALGLAVGSAKIFGVSMALGAFLAGMVVGRSEFSARAASDALPMRDAFAVLFFVSVGMLLNPFIVLDNILLLVSTCAVILIGKPLAALCIILALKYPLRIALTVSMALAQIGEFSFILGALGKHLGVLDEVAMNTLVAASIVSIILSPLLYKAVGPLERWILGSPRLASWVPTKEPNLPADLSTAESDALARTKRHRAIIIGYGPVGQTVARLLQQNGVDPTIIELNLETVRRIRDEGMNAVYGDASQRQILLSAGIEHAGSIILSSAGMSNSEAIIRLARQLAPTGVHVLARTSYVRELADLHKAGANRVFAGEGEVALAFIEAVLRPLGATAEQIDRERDRFRVEVLGKGRIVVVQ